MTDSDRTAEPAEFDNDPAKFNEDIISEFRANGGKVAGQFEAFDLLLLTSTGAKSGAPRISPLAYFDVDGNLIIVGSFAGAPHNPAWVHNLRANSRARVEVGQDDYDVTARELPPAERDPIFARLTAAAPALGEYQSKTSRVIPLFELQPA